VDEEAPGALGVEKGPTMNDDISMSARSRMLLRTIAMLVATSPTWAQNPSPRPVIGIGPGARTFPTLQAAVDSLDAKAGGTIYLQRAVYTLDKPLNLRGRSYVSIVGEGRSTIITASFPPGSRWPVIDMTGATRCSLRHLAIRCHTARCGLLLARRGDRSGAGEHYFEGMEISGDYSLACEVSIASEVNRYMNCYWITGDKPRAHCLILAGEYSPQLEIDSPYGEIAGGSASDNLFFGCQFNVYGRTGHECNVIVQGPTHDIAFYGGMWGNKAADPARPETGGLAGMLLDDRRGKVQQILLDHIVSETYGARNFLRGVGASYGVIVRGCRLDAAEAIINVDRAENYRVTDSVFTAHAEYDWQVQGRRPVMAFGELLNSEIDDTHALTVRAATNRATTQPEAVRGFDTSVAVGSRCLGSTMRTLRGGDVRLPSKTFGTIVEELNVQARRRIGEYGVIHEQEKR